jgi:hypothetical protein
VVALTGLKNEGEKNHADGVHSRVFMPTNERTKQTNENTTHFPSRYSFYVSVAPSQGSKQCMVLE